MIMGVFALSRGFVVCIPGIAPEEHNRVAGCSFSGKVVIRFDVDLAGSQRISLDEPNHQGYVVWPPFRSFHVAVNRCPLITGQGLFG